MKEVKRFHPRRRPLQFDQVDQDHSDEFYECHFAMLLVEIHTLVSSVFCPGSKYKRPRLSPWLQPQSKQFVTYVELVARPDPLTDDWERLLRDDTERKCLLQAIIIKVLDTQVFSSLLFGANSEHGNILGPTDASLVNVEGFRRSNLRTQTNRVYLEAERGQPPIFWEEVDKLCAQVLALLMPMYAWTSQIEGWHPPSISEFYQLLHDIFSYASWINTCIQLSPCSLTLDWVTPGERYHVAQVNLSQEAYESSVREHDQCIKRGAMSKNRRRVARVKISAVPNIIRSKPAVDACGTEGMEMYTIMRPHVMYYHGLQLDRDNDDTHVSLSRYVRKLRDRKSAPHGTAFFIMLLAFIWWWVKTQPSGQNAWRSIRQGLSPTSETGPQLK